jgi:hypothetical protein
MNGRTICSAMFFVVVVDCGDNSYDELFAANPLGSGGTDQGDSGVSGTGGTAPGQSGGAGKRGGSAGREGTGGSSGTAGGTSGAGGSAETGGSNGTGGDLGAGGALGSGGTPSDAGESCADLLKTANALLGEAQVCTGNGTTECHSSVTGYCNCPVLVTSPDSAATSAYLSALAKYDTQCPHACPLIVCPTPTGKCGAASAGGVRQCVRTGVGPATQ